MFHCGCTCQTLKVTEMLFIVERYHNVLCIEATTYFIWNINKSIQSDHYSLIVATLINWINAWFPWLWIMDMSKDSLWWKGFHLILFLLFRKQRDYSPPHCVHKGLFWGISEVIHFLRIYTHRSPYSFDSISWYHCMALYCEIFMRIIAQVCTFKVGLLFLLYWC